MTRQVAKILVVDDEPQIRLLLREILKREGYEVEIASSGEEALEKLSHEGFRMVITDLRMPGMDGFGLISTIKEVQPEIATIMITAYATVETAVQALCHGADDYVTKPFDNNELRKVVSRILEAQQLKSQNKTLYGQLKHANEELQKHKHDAGADTREGLEETNRRLTNKLQQFAALKEISEAVTSLLDLDQVLEACLKHINEKLDAESSSIMLLDQNKTHLIVRASSKKEILGHRQRIGERIAGWVAQYREPLLIDDIRKSAKFQSSGYGNYQSHSLLSLPLVSKARLLGVINITDRSSGEGIFTEDDVSFLTMVAGQIAIAIENAMLYRDLQNNTLQTLAAIADSLDARDPATAGHSRRVTDYAVRLADAMNLDEDSIETVRVAGRLHDIGMISVYDSIKSKPAALNGQEMQQLRAHTGKGDKIIKSTGFLNSIGRIIKHHHERWDGSGYPDGLKADEIPFLSRIMAIADSWDAITSNRPYRSARSTDEAMMELQRHAGSQFDPHMVKVFLDMQKDQPGRPPRPGTGETENFLQHNQ